MTARLLPSLCAGLLALPLLLTDARADISAERRCDKLAAHPDDPDKPLDIVGVPDAGGTGMPDPKRLKKKDIAAAIKACEGAARAPGAHPRFLYQLARVRLAELAYAKKMSIKRKREEALHAMHEAAAAGSDAALSTLWMAEMAMSMDPKRDKSHVREEIKKFEETIEKAAKNGSVSGMMMLANSYKSRQMDGTENIAMAKFWMEKAAEKSVAAMVDYADQLSGNEREPLGAQDYPAALPWYEKAASMDHASSTPKTKSAYMDIYYSVRAMTTLARWAEDGIAGPKDLSRAKVLYEKAATYCDEGAIAKLRDYAAQGIAGPVDQEAATAYYKLGQGITDRHYYDDDERGETLRRLNALTFDQPLAPNVQSVVTSCRDKAIRGWYFGLI